MSSQTLSSLRLWQAGLRGNPGPGSPSPSRAYLSVLVPGPAQSSQLDGTKASAARRLHTHSHTSPWGRQQRRESSTESLKAAARVHTLAERDTRKPSVCVFSFFFLVFFFCCLVELLMRQAGSAPSHLSLGSRGGRRGVEVCVTLFCNL